MDYTNPYQTPVIPPLPPPLPPAGKMPLSQILFSFTGRIPRRTYWLWQLVMAAPILLVIFVALAAAPTRPETGVHRHVEHVQNASNPMPVMGMVLLFIGVLVFIFLFWIRLALAIKRWHDRGKSGAWYLIAFIPYVGAIWALIECGCLRGTEGPNQFGEDPT